MQPELNNAFGDHSRKNHYRLAYTIAVAAIAVLYFLSLHQGHSWSGDFSQYIHHAKNIVEGKHYADTGYIISGVSRFVGPSTYPPVFPILLAPIYLIDGINFEAFKLVAIFSLCLVLLLLPKLLSPQLSPNQLLVTILIIGANPFVWGYSNEILSDFSFIFFSYLALFIMRQLHDPANVSAASYSKANRYLLSCMLGLIMYLAYGCREIGIILPLCVITYDIVVARRLSIVAIISIALFSILAYLQHRLLNANFIPEIIQQSLADLAIKNSRSTSISHLDFVNLNPSEIISRIQRYRWSMQGFLPFNGQENLEILNSIISHLAMSLAFIGYLISLFRKITVLEIFFAGYVAVLLLFGAPTYTRYLLPLFPLTIYYLFIAYQTLLNITVNKPNYLITIRSAGYAVLASTAVSYGYAIKTVNYDVVDYGIEHPQSKAMFAFIRNNTSEDDIIVFRKPRVMALLTQRTSIGEPSFEVLSPEIVDKFFVAASADYYVDMALDKWMYPLQHSKAPSQKFSTVFKNDFFVVYKFRDPN